MATYDERIILHGNTKEKEQDYLVQGKVEQSDLTAEQQALAAHYQIPFSEFAERLQAEQSRHQVQLDQASQLLKLIDRILNKHHPQIKCKLLFCYEGKAYRMMLKKEQGRTHMEYFTSDLLEELFVAGKAEGLEILEGIVAGAVKKLQ